MATLEAHHHHDDLRPDAQLGCLLFMGEQVFPAQLWYDDGLYFVQPLELDVVASASTREDSVRKCGGMIEDLFTFLYEEVADDRTVSEDETLALIAGRLVPVFVRHHKADRSAALRERLRALLRPSIEWKLGPSTHEKSVPALSA